MSNRPIANRVGSRPEAVGATTNRLTSWPGPSYGAGMTYGAHAMTAILAWVMGTTFDQIVSTIRTANSN